MKGVESRLDQRGVQLPCPDPEDGPGVEDAISGAPGGGVPARHAGAFYEVPDYEVALFGAPLPHACEGQGKGRRPPRLTNNRGDESCLLARGCLKIESE